jgi:hypothetical protein
MAPPPIGGEIERIEAEINARVYALFDLAAEEIALLGLAAQSILRFASPHHFPAWLIPGPVLTAIPALPYPPASPRARHGLQPSQKVHSLGQCYRDRRPVGR